MRHLSLSYSSALFLARSSGNSIAPNVGFERQLRIWEHCKYSIYQSDLVNRSKGSLGALKGSKRPARLKIKPAYKAYLAERDNLLKRGEKDTNRARFSSMASMAAQFGRRITQREAQAQEQKTSRSQTDGTGKGKALPLTKLDSEKRRRDSWERVEQMEKEWNARLMGGGLVEFSESVREPKKEVGLNSDDTR